MGGGEERPNKAVGLHAIEPERYQLRICVLMFGGLYRFGWATLNAS